MQNAPDSKKRFSNRVGDYVKWRPSYPDSAIELLFDELGLKEPSQVADVGSGTGMLSKLLLGRVEKIYAVEPNKEMREAAEKELSGRPGFVSVEGSAESSGLSKGSVDMVLCAQSFHWFDRAAAKREFARILRRRGFVALLWNSRLDDTPFGADYEKLICEISSDYLRVDHRKIGPKEFGEFFQDGLYEERSFPYCQHMDFRGLLGRTKSSSYIPLPGQPGYERLESGLKEIFDKHGANGIVDIPYRTQVIWGRP
jgi:SAM-dependent methyltransferase